VPVEKIEQLPEDDLKKYMKEMVSKYVSGTTVYAG